MDLWQTLTLVGTALSAAAGGAFAVARLLRAAGRRWRLVEDFLGDWAGRPARPGHDREPGVMERLAGVESVVAGVDQRLARVEDAVARRPVRR